MGRWFALGVVAVGVLAAVGQAEPAVARDRGPVCRLPSVIDEIAREVRDRNYYSEINPTLVTETETAEANLVRCQVCVLSAPYEITQFGEAPVRQCLAHGFEVRILPGGFVVRDLG